MTESVSPEVRKPGIVLFAAVLNFTGAALIALVMIFFLSILVVHGTSRLVQNISGRVPNMEAYGPAGVIVAIVVILIFLAGLMAISLVTGFGLLKARKFAWYFQIIISLTGLFFVPLGTVLNGIVLFFFFRHSARDYFKI